MSDDPPLNWVQRRKRIENNLASGLDELWRDIRSALEDASRSLKDEYQYESETETVNGHRFRVKIVKTPTQSKIRQVDLDCNQQKRMISVEFIGGSKASQHYALSADGNGVFILDSDEKITPDEMSCRILEPLFFERPIGFRRAFLGH